jgi:hypothetical protein
MKYVIGAAVFAITASFFVHITFAEQQRTATPTPGSDQRAEAGPRYTAAGELIRPADFREWIFVTSGLGMTYSNPTPRPDSGQAGPPRTPSFTNVYVNPPSYHAFMKTGRWPDKTMFILEVRRSATEGSINKGGNFQSDLLVIEASVKDESRYPGKWAYFDFGRDMKPQVAALPTTERCYSCHAEHGAVDNTFVQFYPTLLEVATKLGTARTSSTIDLGAR